MTGVPIVERVGSAAVQATARPLGVRGGIKVYSLVSNVLDEVVLNAAASTVAGDAGPRAELGFAIAFGAGGRLRVLFGLWASSSPAELREFYEESGPGSSAAGDALPLEAALVRAHETSAFASALAFAEGGTMSSAYLAEWYEARAPAPPTSVMSATLASFADAWRRSDIDGLMRCMVANPTYRTSSGACYDGVDAVRAGLTAMCKPSPAATEPRAPEEVHFFGHRSLTYWTLSLPAAAGGMADVRGVDLITYDACGRILLKDAYRKIA